MDHEYVFDITLAATIRVKASNEDMAKAIMRDVLDCADTNMGAWPDGSPILCEASLDGEPSLVEVDGEPPKVIRIDEVKALQLFREWHEDDCLTDAEVEDCAQRLLTRLKTHDTSEDWRGRADDWRSTRGRP